MSQPIRILIADDHPVLRKGLREMINATQGLQVVAEAENGTEAVRMYGEINPDVTIMDMEMPEMTGVEAIRAIRKTDPDARILVVTSFSDKHQVAEAVKAGALGYVLKVTHPRELVDAVRTVAQGHRAIPQDVAGQLAAAQSEDDPYPQDVLTRRELDVLKLVAQGLPNQKIAEQLSLTERSVRVYITRILDKLGLKNRTQAALYAVRKRVVSIE